MTDDDDPSIGEFVGRNALELSAEEVSDLLSRSGHGVLALADGGEAYATPVSVAYDGDRTVYFQFGFGGESTRRAYLGATERACLVVYEVDPPGWESVVASGPIAPVPEEGWEEAYAAHDDNAWTPLNAFERPLADVEFEFYALDIESISGLGTRALEGRDG